MKSDLIWRIAFFFREHGRRAWSIRICRRSIWEYVGMLSRKLNLIPSEIELTFGPKLSLPNGFRGSLNYLSGTYESQVAKVISDLLKPGGTFVDLGANIGFYTLLACSKVGELGTVYSFEPDSSLCISIQKSLNNNGFQNSRLYQMAVADFCGVASFHANPGGVSGSLSEPHHKFIEIRDVDVEVTTLDSFFSNLNWPKIDVIKMDIEGAEMSALNGMRQLLQRSHPLHLVMEFNLNRLRSEGVTPGQLLVTLEDVGFKNVQVIERELRSVNYTYADWLSEEASKEPFRVLNLLCTT